MWTTPIREVADCISPNLFPINYFPVQEFVRRKYFSTSEGTTAIMKVKCLLLYLQISPIDWVAVSITPGQYQTEVSDTRIDDMTFRVLTSLFIRTEFHL